MFWTILLYIYLGISALTLILSILIMIDVTIKLRKKHPNAKYEKDSKISTVIAWIRLLLISLFPILNIGLAITIILNWDDLATAMIEKVEDKLEENEK